MPAGNHHLLNDVLKGAWGYKGWVMSDWGAVPEWEFALKGLDQESGVQIDVDACGASSPSRHRSGAAYAEGKLPKERLSDMVRRILRSVYAVGIDKWGPAPEGRHGEAQRDRARNRAAGHRAAEERRRAAARDRQAAEDRGDRRLCPVGVPTGTGSGAVLPVGGYAARHPDRRSRASMGACAQPVPPAVVAARGAEEAPAAGADRVRPRARRPAEAALLAQRSDVVIVFGIRVEGEGFDLPDLSLPWGQDAVIDAVATANPEHHRRAGNRQPGRRCRGATR